MNAKHQQRVTQGFSIDDEEETPHVRTRAEILAQHGLADSEPERVIHGTVVAESADSTTGNKFVSELDASSPLEAIENQITAISRQYYGELGALLELIREHRKWEPAGYASWDGYLHTRWGWTRQYGNQLIRVAPVIQDLANYSDREINAGQGKALLPVWEDSRDKAIEVWRATSGSKSAEALVEKAIELGYLRAKDRPSPTVWRRVTPVLPVVKELSGQAADLVREAPARSVELAFYLTRAVQEITAEMPEDMRATLHQALDNGQPPHSSRG